LFEIGKVYHGFKFNEKTYVEELKSNVYIALHEKSGARLMYVEADDDNKVFNIAFKTVPENDTGVMHILEHSVLNGSDKYPVREPFVELLKSSMQTFLNAMTYPDKTMYPVASCNEKDFENLMDVYLDAVFHPAIYQRKTTFLQEGWHYEPKTDEADECFRGVVYNEMKGEMSSEDSLLTEYLQNSVFPDICYSKNSGGAPEAIPSLTYDEFIATHQKFYHPENSYIYLYGNMDVDKKLAMLDEGYLSHYDRINADIKIGVQPDRGEMHFCGKYDSQESENGATHYAFGYKVGLFDEREKLLAVSVLLDAISSNNESPLKKELLKRGICEEAWAYVDDQLINPYVCIALKRCDNDDEKVASALKEILSDIADKGIDKSILEASLNQLEFRLREADFGNMPSGLIYCTMAMQSWLYGGDPTLYLRYEDALASVRKKAESGYFEELIREIFLDSKHFAVVKLLPDASLAEEKNRAEKARVEAYRKKIGEEGVKKAAVELEELRKAQNTPDLPENLAKIPVLSLSDISPEIERIPNEDRKISSIPVRYHNIETKKILYIKLYFNMGTISEELLPYAAFASGLFGRMGTAKKSAAQVINELKIKTGSFSASVSAFTPLGKEGVNVMLSVSFSALSENIADAMSLVGEVISQSRFDVGETEKILLQEKMNRELSMSRNGHAAAILRLKSYTSEEGAVNQKIGGTDYYFFIKKLSEAFGESEAKKLEDAVKPFINSDNLLVSVTGDEEIYEKVSENLSKLNLPRGEKAEGVIRTHVNDKNEGVTIPSDVSYVAKGGKITGDITGDWYVLSHIMSYDYLWNTIRAKGGAYGTGLSVSVGKDVCFYSYRDPNLSDTLTAYDKAYDYVKSFSASDREMTKYIIGAIASGDKPKSPKAKAQKSDSDFFNNITEELRAKTRREMLSATPSSIASLAEPLKNMLDENIICVFSSKEKIEQNGDKFKSVITIK
jgi:hypothetical protein